jgi:hypothetical protein
MAARRLRDGTRRLAGAGARENQDRPGTVALDRDGSAQPRPRAEPLGGLGRRPRVDGRPGRLTADVPSPGSRLQLTVTTSDDDAVAVRYADPSGGARAVRHAPLADVELVLRRPGGREAALSSNRGAYEYGTSQSAGEVTPQPLPEG